jgi:hypothetical protein
MTSVSVAAQFIDNKPASYTITTNRSGVKVAGTKTTIAARTSTTLTKRSKIRWKQTVKDVESLKAKGVAADTTDAPTFTSISPSTLANDANQLATITGTGFEAGASVVLVDADDAEVALGSVTRVSATSITFKVPTTVEAGVYALRITDTQLVITVPDAVTITVAPVFTSVAPSTLANDANQLATITGAGFEAGASVVLVDGDDEEIALANVTRVSASSITFKVPTTVDAGVYSLRITDTQQALTAPAAVTVTDAPIFTSVAPASVPNNATTVATITGAGFESGASVVLVDGDDQEIALANVTRVSASSITFRVPTTVDAGVYSLKITDTEQATTATDVLTVTAA